MNPLIPAGIFKKKILVISFSFFIVFSKAQDTTVNKVKDSTNTTAVRIPAIFAEAKHGKISFMGVYIQTSFYKMAHHLVYM